NETAMTGFWIAASSVRATSGTAIDPEPDRARTASAKTTASASFAAAAIGAASSVRESTRNVCGGAVSRLRIPRSNSGSGETVSGKSLTVTMTTRASSGQPLAHLAFEIGQRRNGLRKVADGDDDDARVFLHRQRTVGLAHESDRAAGDLRGEIAMLF